MIGVSQGVKQATGGEKYFQRVVDGQIFRVIRLPRGDRFGQEFLGDPRGCAGRPC
jgi:hypothetical protein